MYIKKIIITATAIILSMFAVQAQTPGGVTNSNIVAWLTPDSYSSGTWVNRITGSTSIGNFAGASVAPLISNAGGFNFHPMVQFDKPTNSTAPNSLLSAQALNMSSTSSISTIFVLQRRTTDNWDFLIGFGNTDNQYSMSWRTNNSDNLTLAWPTSTRTIGAVRNGILAVDNSNASSPGANVYINGSGNAYSSGQWNGTTSAGNGRVSLGGGRNNQAWYGYQGGIQEFILIKNAGNGYLNPIDLQKIHSYLGLKYGITINNNSNYIASDGTVVWTIDPGYRSNIFGIGRDDDAAFYQKQSISASNDLTTIFLGDKVETLNSQNTGSIGNKQFIVFGSNGLNSLSPANIADGTSYVNGNIDASNGLNYQSGIIYKAQLTNFPPAGTTVKLKLKGDYLYAFVSKDNTFSQGNTKIYPVNSSKIATITIDSEYKYIRYAGFTTGPGGVGGELRLWLSATDESSLNIQNLPLTDPKLTSYPSSYLPAGSTTVPAVQSWTDPLRGQTYSYTSAESSVARIPVYEPSNLMMNFHPSVRFWGSGSSYGSYLVNTSGITTTPTATQRSANFKHTAYFVTANMFSQGNPWVYELMFGSDLSSYNGPGYGMQQLSAGNNDDVFGRFRTSGFAGRGNVRSFSVGATSINGYFQSGQSVKFRFNGIEDEARALDGGGSATLSWGNFNLNQRSYLGRGYLYDRTLIGVMSEVIIFEKGLDADETRRLESYLAIKYGATLRPSNTSTKRFNYALSNGFIFWHGDVADSDPNFGNQATFYNNIAAVIRDDASKLLNIQSHSTNAGSILHMGIAGRKLGSDFDLGEMPNDKEVVVWGSNTDEGVINVNAEPCADFEHIFKRKWLVSKYTEADRPITMIVGAENNSLNNIGSAVNANVMAMYTALADGNDVCMIVADSPDKLTPGNSAYGDFLAVVPMRFIDGEQQCRYTFSKPQVYITFGYKPTRRGCFGEIQFAGTKTYNWNTRWTRQNYTLDGNGVKTINKTAVDLGDNINVSTRIVYDNGLRADVNYPRFVSSPSNALQIQRRYGLIDASKVTTTITFNTPVLPEFSISGLDGSSRQFDEVTIRASCPGGVAVPTLSYAGQSPTYRIEGNRARVNTTRSASATDRNGTVNVSFQYGVTQIVIEYAIQNRIAGSTAQSIFISPIRMRNVAPAPTVNEDGLSFSKQVQDDAMYNCETVEYTFYVGNVNTEDKYVHIKDVLPDKMKWVAGSVGLDTINAANSDIKFNSYGGTNTLEIDSLLVPCTSEIMFKAFAMLDNNAPSDEYANQAAITYERIINNVSTFPTHYSEDRYTLNPYTVFFSIEDPQPLDTIKVYATVNPVAYSPNNETTVSLKVVNPNAQNVANVYLDLTWDAGFKYVANSFNNAASSVVFLAGTNETTLSVAGNSLGTQGFNLPANSETIFSFRIIAPTTSNLEHAIDPVTGQTINRIIPATVYYNFVVDSDNPCIAEDMEASDVLEVPFQRTHIIVNQKNTPKTIK